MTDTCEQCGRTPGSYTRPEGPIRADTAVANECDRCHSVHITGDPIPDGATHGLGPDQTESRIVDYQDPEEDAPGTYAARVAAQADAERARLAATPPHLVTLGLNDHQRALLEGLVATHVLIDFTEEHVRPEEYMVRVVDAAVDHPAALLMVGPLAFGYACSGRLSDLGPWARAREPRTLVVIAADRDDPETVGLASQTYVVLGAGLGMWLEQPEVIDWLRRHTDQGGLGG